MSPGSAPQRLALGSMLDAVGLPPAPFREVLVGAVHGGRLEPHLIEPSLGSSSDGVRLGVNAAARRDLRGPERAATTLELLRALGVADRAVAEAVVAWLDAPAREAFVGLAAGDRGDRAKLYFRGDAAALAALAERLGAPALPERGDTLCVDYRGGEPVAFKHYEPIGPDELRRRAPRARLLDFIATSAPAPRALISVRRAPTGEPLDTTLHVAAAEPRADLAWAERTGHAGLAARLRALRTRLPPLVTRVLSESLDGDDVAAYLALPAGAVEPS